MPFLEEKIPRNTYGSSHYFLNLLKALDPEEQEQITEAMFTCAEWHGIQRRKTGQLFIMHPIQVASILLHMKADLPTVVAALLHDVVEDTEISHALIKERFGPEVTQLVEAVTDLRVFAKKENLEKVYSKSQQDPRIAWIKLADACANLMHQSQKPFSKEKHHEHLEEYEAYHYKLLSTLPTIPSALVQMLRRVLDQSHQEFRARLK